MNARDYLAQALAAALPDHKIVRAQRDPGTIDRPTIVIKQQRLEPEQATAAHFRVTFVVTIVTEQTDPERAEDALDELVTDLIRQLDALPALVFESAEKVMYGDQNMAYDLRIQTLTPKE